MVNQPQLVIIKHDGFNDSCFMMASKIDQGRHDHRLPSWLTLSSDPGARSIEGRRRLWRPWLEWARCLIARGSGLRTQPQLLGCPKEPEDTADFLELLVHFSSYSLMARKVRCRMRPNVVFAVVFRWIMPRVFAVWPTCSPCAERHREDRDQGVPNCIQLLHLEWHCHIAMGPRVFVPHCVHRSWKAD